MVFILIQKGFPLTRLLWTFFGETIPFRYAKGLTEALGRKVNELQEAIQKGIIKEVGVGVDSQSFFRWLRREFEVEKIIKILKEIKGQLGKQSKILQELLKR